MREDDPRFKRSRRLMRAALIDLAQENPQDLTVSAICEATGIDRATFYRHFPALEHLVADTLGALSDESAAEWEQMTTGEGDQADLTLSVLTHYLEHIEANRALYSWALGSEGSAAAIHAISSRITVSADAEVRRLYPDESEAQHRLRARFASGAVFGVILGWLSNPDPEPAPDLAVWLVQEIEERLVDSPEKQDRAGQRQAVRLR